MLNEAKKKNIAISQELLRAACSSLTSKFAQPFAEALLEHESNLDSKFVAFASKHLLCLPEIDVWFSLWLQPERFSRLALNALIQEDEAVVNAIAAFSILTLQHCDNVLSKVAEHISRLTPEARQNFLVASIKSAYRQKEELLLALSNDKELDTLSLEAVVAGLCACATQSAIARVIELADRKEMDEKLAAVGAGIIHGSSLETLKLLSQYKWSNPSVKYLIDGMQRTEDHELEDNNCTESDKG